MFLLLLVAFWSHHYSWMQQLFFPCSFPAWTGCFWGIEFFWDIFVGKPSVNFHQCCIFHVQWMFAVTSLIPCEAGHFFKITTTTIKFCEKTSKILHCNDFIIYVFENKLRTNNVQCNGFTAQIPNLSWLHD